MKVAIYHAQNSRDSLFYEANGDIYNAKQALAAFDSGLYTHVAEMDVSGAKSALETAFYRSQNLDSDWKPPCRSSSVGDIFKLTHDNGAVEWHIVARFGFDKLKG